MMAEIDGSIIATLEEERKTREGLEDKGDREDRESTVRQIFNDMEDYTQEENEQEEGWEELLEEIEMDPPRKETPMEGDQQEWNEATKIIRRDDGTEEEIQKRIEEDQAERHKYWTDRGREFLENKVKWGKKITPEEKTRAMDLTWKYRAVFGATLDHIKRFSGKKVKKSS